ncbi:MFS transporter [Caenimonas sedimenti]|uniref:MFS transporter n=1 Tax=Caenimonas sedimenti TaxID=2596921 RepID=A0A562ZXN8_9BURK|nr:MFS transporter [Caenimonas sedimenti]TWO73380.1 MFS transporter [Caenimonas sedimenti]
MHFVTLLALAAFFSGAALRICDGLIPRLAADFGLTTGQAGSVVITFSIAYGLMQLVFGPFADRFGKARMVTVAVGGCSVLALVSAAAPNFDTLLIARVAWGMAAAGIIPLAMAWIGDAVPFEERQPTLARFLTGTLSGMMAGQLAGGLFADSAWGWRGAFAALAAGFAVVTVLLVVRMRAASVVAAPAPATGFLDGLRRVASTPWAWRVLAAALAEGILLLGPVAYLPAFLHQRFGLSLSAVTAMLALNAVGGLVYAMSARKIVARMGQLRMVLVGGWVMGLGYLAYLFSPWAWTAGPVALLVGFGTYLFHNTLQTHATQMVPEVRGSAVAVFAFCLFTGQAIGVTLCGYAYDHGGAAWMLLPTALGLPAVGWGFARALRRHQRTAD